MLLWSPLGETSPKKSKLSILFSRFINVFRFTLGGPGFSIINISESQLIISYSLISEDFFKSPLPQENPNWDYLAVEHPKKEN